jgi:hypothetical protein
MLVPEVPHRGVFWLWSEASQPDDPKLPNRIRERVFDHDVFLVGCAVQEGGGQKADFYFSIAV